MPPSKIPLSVIIATKNEEANINPCLQALQHFDEILVVDSASTDQTRHIAETLGATMILFHWNGQYPKKRQWILDNVATKHEWVLFMDADEIMTPELQQELQNLFATGPQCAGYFIKGQYIWENRKLRFGLRNKKLCLLDRSKFTFPPVNDLKAPGMGEIEGHYQPTLKAQHKNEPIGTLKHSLIHHACTNKTEWLEKHERYAAWEHYMNSHNLWPAEDSPWRNALKTAFRRSKIRPHLAFLHSYIIKAGFLDGRAGFDFARHRYLYYQMIAALNRKSS